MHRAKTSTIPICVNHLKSLRGSAIPQVLSIKFNAAPCGKTSPLRLCHETTRYPQSRRSARLCPLGGGSNLLNAAQDQQATRFLRSFQEKHPVVFLRALAVCKSRGHCRGMPEETDSFRLITKLQCIIDNCKLRIAVVVWNSYAP